MMNDEEKKEERKSGSEDEKQPAFLSFFSHLLTFSPSYLLTLLPSFPSRLFSREQKKFQTPLYISLFYDYYY
ncbi:MAG: hypothetical protein NT166_07830 [Candidatus Aminicenantes bacterium]|nr:hypothetical protein [Candidatus Aminicenantes bacterium]